jgi:hypothetical protein
MRKIHDAILFGAQTVKMDSFLLSFKKENADACSKGNVDEKSADNLFFYMGCGTEKYLCLGMDNFAIEPHG